MPIFETVFYKKCLCSLMGVSIYESSSSLPRLRTWSERNFDFYRIIPYLQNRHPSFSKYFRAHFSQTSILLLVYWVSFEILNWLGFFRYIFEYFFFLLLITLWTPPRHRIAFVLLAVLTFYFCIHIYQYTTYLTICLWKTPCNIFPSKYNSIQL